MVRSVPNIRDWDPRSPNVRTLGGQVDESDSLTWHFDTGVDASTTWNFGDEATATTADGTASHTYADPGDYTVVAIAVGLEAVIMITVEAPPAPSAFAASSAGYSSAQAPYPAWVLEWNGVINTPGLTANCVGRLRLTLATVDPALTWFQIDAGGFASGTSTRIDSDPHYHGTGGYYPSQVDQCAGNRAVNATGGPFEVGQVIEVTFTADYLVDQYDGDGYTYGEISLPSAFTTSAATFSVVTP